MSQKLLSLFFLVSSFYLSHSHPLERELIPRRLQVEQGSCPGIFSFQLEAAIQDAINLANAGINAATSFSTVPFSYFFSPDIVTANIVASVLTRVAAVNGPEAHDILLSCIDHRNVCHTIEGFTPAYAVQPPPGRSGLFGIVMCPDAFERLPRSPVPCSNTPGSLGVTSLGSVLLHELVHLENVARLGVIIGDVAVDPTARSVHVALGEGKNTTLDANAYEHMTSFAWGLGLGAPLWQGGACLQDFSNGNFDSEW